MHIINLLVFLTFNINLQMESKEKNFICHTLTQTFTKQTTNLNMGSSFQK